jgi:hypothetical protein
MSGQDVSATCTTLLPRCNIPPGEDLASRANHSRDMPDADDAAVWGAQMPHLQNCRTHLLGMMARGGTDDSLDRSGAVVERRP